MCYVSGYCLLQYVVRLPLDLLHNDLSHKKDDPEDHLTMAIRSLSRWFVVTACWLSHPIEAGGYFIHLGQFAYNGKDLLPKSRRDTTE